MQSRGGAGLGSQRRAASRPASPTAQGAPSGSLALVPQQARHVDVVAARVGRPLQARQWLPRDGQQQRALQAYLRWHRQDEPLLWQALQALLASRGSDSPWPRPEAERHAVGVEHATHGLRQHGGTRGTGSGSTVVAPRLCSCCTTSLALPS